MATVEKSKKKKRISCLVIAVLVIALLGVLVKVGLSAMQNMNLLGESYTYGEAAVKDLSTYVNISGAVSSSSTVNLTSEVLQKVVQLNVKVGDSVKKGDVVCVLDSASLQEQLDKLKERAAKSADADAYNDGILRRTYNDAVNARNEAVAKAQQSAADAERTRDQAYERQKELVEQFNALITRMNDADAETQESLKPQADALEASIQKLTEQLPALDEAAEQARQAIQTVQDSGDKAVRAKQGAIDASK